jgi:hypothetical protein
MISRWKTTFMAVALVALAAGPASAQTYTLRANLTGSEEVPNILTGAFGSATVVVDMTARTITWTVDVFNLPSGVTAGHIHVGGLGVASGPTMVNFTVPTSASNDFRISGTAGDSGITLRPDQGIRSADDAYQAILGGNTYVNVHSQVNGGGEIRGQLRLVQ